MFNNTLFEHVPHRPHLTSVEWSTHERFFDAEGTLRGEKFIVCTGHTVGGVPVH